MSDNDDEPNDKRGAEPLRLLIDWANKQDGWVRWLVSEIVETRKPISDEQSAELFEIYLSEKGLSDRPFDEPPRLGYDVDSVSADESLQLVKLCDVQGVNALTPGYDIEFSPGLTILYGENGTGKTGYARVLKRLAAVRRGWTGRRGTCEWWSSALALR